MGQPIDTTTQLPASVEVFAAGAGPLIDEPLQEVHGDVVEAVARVEDVRGIDRIEIVNQAELEIAAEAELPRSGAESDEGGGRVCPETRSRQ